MARSKSSKVLISEHGLDNGNLIIVAPSEANDSGHPKAPKLVGVEDLLRTLSALVRRYADVKPEDLEDIVSETLIAVLNAKPQGTE